MSKKRALPEDITILDAVAGHERSLAHSPNLGNEHNERM